MIPNGRYANRPDRPLRRVYSPKGILWPIIAGQFKINKDEKPIACTGTLFNGFKDIQNPFMSLFMKIYAWFSFSMIALAVYVFITTFANGSVPG